MSTNDQKDPKSPATTSAAYDRMAPRWRLIETLLGGTEALRAAGELYLPMHQEETAAGYDERLNQAVLFNMVGQTLDTLAGKPFSEPVGLDDVPEAIEKQVLYDVDLQGNNIDVFARQLFREGMAKAFAHVLIDYPRPAEREDGQPRTLADDRADGLRPYWVIVKPECVLFARSEIIQGVETLQHIRILETYTEQEGFAEVQRRRIRVLEPGTVMIYEPTKDKTARGEEKWTQTDAWATGLGYIPLVTFYANRDGFMEGKPPLLDQAWLNVAHWQSTSDQRHILKVARFPILACSGATAEDSDPVVVGPNKVLYNPDPNGKFYYVEHDGAAIAAGRQDLIDLQEQMAGYGAEFLKLKPGNPTATGRALDSAEASSDLAAMAMVFQDSMAQVLDITAEWMRLTQKGGTVKVVTGYELETEDATTLDALHKARAARDISRETYLEGLKVRGVLSADLEIEEEEERLVEEADAALGRSMLDLDPGAPPPKEEGQPPPA